MSFCLLIISSLNANEWCIRDLGTLSLFESAEVLEFNDCGQVLIKGKKLLEKFGTQQLNEKIYWELWDPKSGLLHIDSCEDSNKGNSYYRVNGQGSIIGLRNTHVNKDKRLDLLLWNRNSGLKSFNLPVYGHPNHETTTFIANCRNSDNVIVSCINSLPNGELFRSEVYSLLNNRIEDLAPTLTKSAAALGFDARRWVVIAVNSRGTILGRFDNYQMNPYKNEKAFNGRKYFLLENENMVLIEGAEELLEWFGNGFTDADHISFDADGRVLIYTFVKIRRSWESWIWTKEEGLYQIGGGHIKGLGILDDGVIFWSITGSVNADGFLFQENSQFFEGFKFPDTSQYLFLPLDTNRQPLCKHLGNFQGIKVKKSVYFDNWPLPGGSEINANALRQIIFNAEIFGEIHPFLIEPV